MPVEFVQNTASDVWTITHNLGYRPSVTLYDTAGDLIFGEVVYPDENTVRVHFSAPTPGGASLI
jgi:ABC-type transport system substrate-binding protein